MYCEIVGVKQSDFKAPDGTEVKGTRVYFLAEDKDQVQDGRIAGSAFIKAELLGSWKPKPGDLATCEYNRYGKLVCWQPVK